MEYREGDKVRILPKLHLMAREDCKGFTQAFYDCGDKVFTLTNRISKRMWWIDEVAFMFTENWFEPYTPTTQELEPATLPEPIDMQGAYHRFAEARQRMMQRMMQEMADAFSVRPRQAGKTQTIEEFRKKYFGIDPAKPGSDVTQVWVDELEESNQLLGEALDEGVFTKPDSDKITKKKELPHIAWIDDCEEDTRELGVDYMPPEVHLPPIQRFEPPKERMYKCQYCASVGTKAYIKEHMQKRHKEFIGLGSPLWVEMEVKNG